MPTLLGLPDADLPISGVDKLWINQGTGTDRDREVQAQDVVGGGLQGFLANATKFTDANGTAGPSRVPVLGSQDSAFQATAKYMAISELVSSQMTGTISSAPAVVRADLLGEHAIGAVGNTFVNVGTSDLWQVAEIPWSAVTLLGYNNGVDSLLSVDGVAGSYVRLTSDPRHRRYCLDVFLELRGKSASASNDHPAQIIIDGTSLGAEWADWAVPGGMRFTPIVWCNGPEPVESGGTYTTYTGYVNVSNTTSGETLSLTLCRPGVGSNWKHIAPASSWGIRYLSFSIVFNKGPA